MRINAVTIIAFLVIIAGAAYLIMKRRARA